MIYHTLDFFPDLSRKKKGKKQLAYMASWLLVFIFLLFFSFITSSVKGINILPVTQAYFFLHFSWICCCLCPQQGAWPPLFLILQQNFTNNPEVLFLPPDPIFQLLFHSNGSPVIFQNHRSCHSSAQKPSSRSPFCTN